MSAKASPWKVHLEGRHSDLQHLELCFTSHPLRVTKDEREGGFVYASDAFGGCAASDEVLAIAEKELSVLSGVLKLARASREPVRAGAVHRCNESGGRDVFVRDTLRVRVDFDVTVEATNCESQPVAESPSVPRTVRFARLALADSAVAKVMRLVAATDSDEWVCLYRIYEVVEADVGGELALKALGWGSADDRRRFKHSANSVAVAGDAARHGKEQTTPPANPMSQEEAVAYVHSLVSSWLSSKGA